MIVSPSNSCPFFSFLKILHHRLLSRIEEEKVQPFNSRSVLVFKMFPQFAHLVISCYFSFREETPRWRETEQDMTVKKEIKKGRKKAHKQENLINSPSLIFYTDLLHRSSTQNRGTSCKRTNDQEDTHAAKKDKWRLKAIQRMQEDPKPQS